MSTIIIISTIHEKEMYRFLYTSKLWLRKLLIIVCLYPKKKFIINWNRDVLITFVAKK